MRCACVDIGTNTTRLLVAEPDPARPGGLVDIALERTFLRLGEAERAGGLGRARVDDLCATVARQVRAAHEAGAARIRVVATAALRDVPDRDQVLACLAAAAGVPVEILSAEEEARLAFAGAVSGAPREGHRTAVVDVGGGSTEVATGTCEDGVRWWASVPVGSGVLTERHLADDPPTPAQLAAARAHAAALLGTLACPGADRAWVVGGGAGTLRRVVGDELSLDAVDRAIAVVCRVPAAETAAVLDLHPERVRLLPAALVLLGEVGRLVGCSLCFGSGGLREGVVLDLVERAA